MTRECKWCKKELQNKRSDALFCNKVCKKRHWDRQKYPIPAKHLTPEERKRMRYNCKIKWQTSNKTRHLETRKTWSKTQYDNNTTYRLSVNLRNRLYRALKGNKKNGSAVFNLGCTLAKLKIYLQLQFRRNPRNSKEYMNWNNHSKAGWHIDHIKPLASFDLSDPEQLKKACHYSNLQPLWWFENLKKSDRIE